MTRRASSASSPSLWMAVILIALVVMVVYSNSFKAPFVFDDTYQIVDNPDIRDWQKFFSLDQLREKRPLVQFTFALNYRLGGLDVWGYHFVNVLIHLFNGILVFFLTRKILFLLFAEPSGSVSLAKGLSASRIFGMALVSALVYVAHPLQTQAVTYIVQRYTSMAAMFYLLSIWLYLEGRQRFQAVRAVPVDENRKGEPKKGKRTFKLEGKTAEENADLFSRRGWGLLYLAGCFVCGLLAFLSKQNAASLPLAIVLMEWVLFDRTWQGWKRKICYFLPAAFIMSLFFLYFSGVLQEGQTLGSLLEDVSEQTRETKEVGRWQYLVTQFNVIPNYIRMLFLPFGQNADPMYGFKTGFWDGYALPGLLFILGLFALGAWIMRKRPLIGLGIFWFFVTLSVESSVLPISDAMFEHRLYLPMFGFGVVMSSLLFEVLPLRGGWRMAMAGAITLSLVAAAHARNRVWNDPVRLWTDVIEKNPENYRGYNNLGAEMTERGRIVEASRLYSRALEIKPDFGKAHNNLGNALISLGRADQAVVHFRQALEHSPDLIDAYNNMGVALANVGDFEGAVRYFKWALELRPDFAEAENGLGNALAASDKVNEAMVHWNRAIALDPTYSKPHYNLGMVLEARGERDRAIHHFQEAIRLEPEYAEAHSRLGFCLMARRDLDGAVQHFSEAIRIRPGLRQAQDGLNKALMMRRDGQP